MPPGRPRKQTPTDDALVQIAYHMGSLIAEVRNVGDKIEALIVGQKTDELTFTKQQAESPTYHSEPSAFGEGEGEAPLLPPLDELPASDACTSCSHSQELHTPTAAKRCFDPGCKCAGYKPA